MPRGCDCPACRMGRLMADRSGEPDPRADDDTGDLRRQDMVSYYMERFGMMYPEAVIMLRQESKLQWKGAVEAMARRHGLDEDDAISHVLAHTVNQSERIQ
jgi:hypothetical protein